MFDQNAIANSPDEWMKLARSYAKVAETLVENKELCFHAWRNAGFAVECSVKAVIMFHHRWNKWPEKSEMPGVYVHDLAKLVRVAQIVLDPLHPTAPSWHTAMHWNRTQSYNPQNMPRKMARSMLAAATGNNGVIPWLATTYQLAF
ncbi:hypothetical protein [Mesorhizobium muleiense]|uniref:hypothetical protein n=1 Tax=Mesorhizobium muleiense TaxID=1004279 RepID=UPI001F1FB43E|nr:hypothetical protein [Mesorhizobium muleiense]MCF6112010.1 hypothetical protein [Mesorhizobium muleiense]